MQRIRCRCIVLDDVPSGKPSHFRSVLPRLGIVGPCDPVALVACISEGLCCPLLLPSFLPHFRPKGRSGCFLFLPSVTGYGSLLSGRWCTGFLSPGPGAVGSVFPGNRGVLVLRRRVMVFPTLCPSPLVSSKNFYKDYFTFSLKISLNS